MNRITRILVPTDFSPTADEALDYAFGLAERFGASLELLHVLDDPFVYDGMSAEVYITEAPMMRTAMLQDAREKLRHRAGSTQGQAFNSTPKCCSATARGRSPSTRQNGEQT